MCEVVTKKHKRGKGYDVEVNCKISGKPIIESNAYGMFCEDRCNFEEAKLALAQFKEFFASMAPLFGGSEEGARETVDNFEKKFKPNDGSAVEAPEKPAAKTNPFDEFCKSRWIGFDELGNSLVSVSPLLGVSETEVRESLDSFKKKFKSR